MQLPVGKFIAQGALDHITYGALRFGHTEIHRHHLQVVGLATGIVLQEHISHLRTVTVADNEIVVSGNKLHQRVAGILYVL